MGSFWPICSYLPLNSVPVPTHQMTFCRRYFSRRSASCAATALLLAFALLRPISAGAATIYWDGTGNGNDWGTATFWSTSSSATTPNPAAAPGSSDIAFFNISTVNTNQSIGLGNTNQAALGLIFNSTGTESFSATGTRTLALGTSGITMNSGAGAVTFDIKAGLGIAGNQNWANNSSSLLSVVTVSNAGNTSPFTLSLTGSGSGGTTISGAIADGGTTGTLALTINTTGGVTTLSGAAANTYTGLTTVSAGELDLAKTGTANAIAGGGLTINGGTVKYTGTSTDMIANTAKVTISGGTLDLNNHADTIGSLTFNSGTLTSTGGTQTLTLAGSTATTLQMQGGATIPTSANLAFSSTATTGVGMTFDASANGTATINGNINLNSTATTGITRTFTINDGTAATDTTIAGVISNTTATGLTKAGAGTLLLSGTTANTYSGLTTVNAGELDGSSATIRARLPPALSAPATPRSMPPVPTAPQNASRRPSVCSSSSRPICI